MRDIGYTVNVFNQDFTRLTDRPQSHASSSSSCAAHTSTSVSGASAGSAGGAPPAEPAEAPLTDVEVWAAQEDDDDAWD